MKRITLHTVFEVAWRLSVLALPWQTRWFADASLAGWPWEQGRWSLYASWFLLATTVAVGFAVRRRSRRLPPAVSSSTPSYRNFPIGKKLLDARSAVALLVFATVVACLFDRDAWKPALQWWLQVSVLALFAWTLVRARIPRRSMAAWFVVSIIPHVGLGMWQYAIQKVIGSPWLGMATQLSESAGVSVVEHGVYRVLRMYGGFPHPNIFAGWTVLGFILALWLAATSATKPRSLGWAFAGSGIGIALLLSYARGAWIAAIVGVAVLVAVTVRAGFKPAPPTDETDRVPMPSIQFFVVALTLILLIGAAVAVPQYDHLATRFDTSQRLEAKSIDTRISSLTSGFDAFRAHWFVGTGPNAELLDAGRRADAGKVKEPLEPPHAAYLLALANVGVVGIIALAILAFLLFRAVLRRPDRGLPVAILSALAVLAMFDHYPWSLWAGQALVASVAVLVFAKNASAPELARSGRL